MCTHARAPTHVFAWGMYVAVTTSPSYSPAPSYSHSYSYSVCLRVRVCVCAHAREAATCTRQCIRRGTDTWLIHRLFTAKQDALDAELAAKMSKAGVAGKSKHKK